MNKLKEMEKLGNDAVSNLRIDTLKSGMPFMINSGSLPSTECYLEYPDGHISIAALSASRRDLDVIRDLSLPEIKALRKEYNFTEIDA